ncbi:uncharacterized protein BDZ83DRAFT_636157 [Colletotrichum acutatum]|uniref:Uncharacterized protein n=1 Tax=Glomerella acutata TaxID=27357 RepID=A0AAD8UC74_GLOAC|nr:uncharacterized protein BDZ83DRAFT_636157 [Colletotrichum acutatum]KAK1715005.1 hypothetical protein BDZ83DRAFT_636157 [Colletotrichum acutatum]
MKKTKSPWSFISMLPSRYWCTVVLCLSSIPATALIQIPSSRQRATSSDLLLRRHKFAENRNPEFDSGESNVIWSIPRCCVSADPVAMISWHEHRRISSSVKTCSSPITASSPGRSGWTGDLGCRLEGV